MSTTMHVNGRHPATTPPEPRTGRACRELLSVKEVGVYLGFDPRTIWRWVKEGRFPAPLKFGVSRRWRREEVERIARAGLQPPPAA